MALDLSALQGLASLMGSSYLQPQSSNAGTAPMLASSNGTPGQSFSQPGQGSQVNIQQLLQALKQQQMQQQQQQQQQLQQQPQQRMMVQPPQVQGGGQIQPMNWGARPMGQS